METLGWVSILPPILAIGLAIVTREVFLSLGFFVWFGWTIINGWNPILGLGDGVEALVTAVGNDGNARTLMFSALIGAMIVYTQRSGGMQGFVNWATRSRITDSPRSVGLFTAVVSMFVFLESNFGLLVSGSVARPLFDRCRISREKLSYIIDATCSPKCILIPLNAWGAYVVSLLVTQNVEDPVRLLVSTLVLNFYPLLAIGLALFVIVTGFDMGPMKEAERRVREEGKLLRDGAEPMVTTEVTGTEAKQGAPLRPVNMILPLATMVITVPIALYMTGEGDILSGSGSKAVLWGVITGLLLGAVMYRAQGIMTVKELVEETVRGMQGLMPLVLVLLLAFGISITITELGTGMYLAQAAEAALNPGFVPALIFLLSCFMAFATGTSWGTFAIMIPLVVPMANTLDLHAGLAVAAALGGGIFGDHCSPISDSTIVASMAAATDHVDHVRTQLPYALTAATGALILYLIFGFIL